MAQASSFSLADLLLSHPFSDDQLLLHTIDCSVSAGDARHHARSTAEQLRSRGIGSGDAVVVDLAPGPIFVSTMMGVFLSGAVFVPLNDRAGPRERSEVIEATAPRAVWREDGADLREQARRYEPDAAFVLWTSGTTGRPKPIVHTHVGYLEFLDRVLNALRARPSREGPTPNLIPVSLTSNAGIYNILFGLRAGAPLVLMERFDTRSFATLVARYDVRSTVLPPAAMVSLADDTRIRGLAPLRYVRSITAPLSPFQARRFAERFSVFVLNGYGQAEIGEVVGWTAADARQHPEKLGAAGRPHRGVSVKVVGENSLPVAAGCVGELFIKTSHTASNQAEGSGGQLDGRLDDEGYVATGDLGRTDAEGFIWIEGRKGEVINRGGNKVFPEQVEEVLRLDPAVKDVAVVGAPDLRLGEVPVALVVADDPIDSGELDGRCRGSLSAYKVPVRFVRVPSLPRNDAGKLLRRELAQLVTELPADAKGTPMSGWPS